MTSSSTPDPGPTADRGTGTPVGPPAGSPKDRRPASAGSSTDLPPVQPLVGRRGSYSKGRARRTEILDRALEEVRERGAQGTSLRRIAESIGVSHAALLHYFSSREQLLLALHQHAERRSRRERVGCDPGAPEPEDGGGPMSPADPGTDDGNPPTDPGAAEGEGAGALADDPPAIRSSDPVEELVAAATANVRVPGLVQLYSTLLGVSLEDREGEAAQYFARRFAGLREAWARQIARQQAEGKVRADVDPEQTASLLIAASDGLQMQWLLDPSIDLEETLAAFETLLRP